MKEETLEQMQGTVAMLGAAVHAMLVTHPNRSELKKSLLHYGGLIEHVIQPQHKTARAAAKLVLAKMLEAIQTH